VVATRQPDGDVHTPGPGDATALAGILAGAHRLARRTRRHNQASLGYVRV
jgi:hypothetical protein